MLKKILLVLVVLQIGLLVLGFWTNSRLDDYEVQTAHELTKDNQELKLEGEHRVFPATFATTRTLCTQVAPYNWIDRVVWQNEAEFSALFKAQLLQSREYEEQYTRQVQALTAAYSTAEETYLNSLLASSTAEQYTATLEQAEHYFKTTQAAQAIEQRRQILAQEMDTFRAQFEQTLAPLTGEEQGSN